MRVCSKREGSILKKKLQNTKFYDSSIYAKKRLFLKREKNSLENLKTLIKILQIFQESEEMKLWYITIFFLMEPSLKVGILHVSAEIITQSQLSYTQY